MSRSRRRRKQRIQLGQSPGTLHIPEGAPKPRLRLSRYSRDAVRIEDDLSVADLGRGLDEPCVRWIEVEGYGDRELFARLEELYGVPRLVLEDVLNGGQRPKVEAYEAGLFCVLRAPFARPAIEVDQLSIFVTGKTLISFVERERDFVQPLHERLKLPSSLLRQSGVDYLLYRLADFVVDQYFPLVDGIEARLEELEQVALADPTRFGMRTLHALADDVRLLRRTVLPMREAIGGLRRTEADVFKTRTLPYLRDVEDHAAGLVDRCDQHRELVGDVRDLVWGSINLRMNEVMRLLAAVSAIFIPLSFITGLYGMNFENMPELGFRYGYFVVLGVLALVAFTAWRVFRRRGWIQFEEE